MATTVAARNASVTLLSLPNELLERIVDIVASDDRSYSSIDGCTTPYCGKISAVSLACRRLRAVVFNLIGTELVLSGGQVRALDYALRAGTLGALPRMLRVKHLSIILQSGTAIVPVNEIRSVLQRLRRLVTCTIYLPRLKERRDRNIREIFEGLPLPQLEGLVLHDRDGFFDYYDGAERGPWHDLDVNIFRAAPSLCTIRLPQLLLILGHNIEAYETEARETGDAHDALPADDEGASPPKSAFVARDLMFKRHLGYDPYAIYPFQQYLTVDALSIIDEAADAGIERCNHPLQHVRKVDAHTLKVSSVAAAKNFFADAFGLENFGCHYIEVEGAKTGQGAACEVFAAIMELCPKLYTLQLANDTITEPLFVQALEATSRRHQVDLCWKRCKAPERRSP